MAQFSGLSGSGAIFDLHVHTVRSDGLLTPMQLADLARRSGLAGFAVVDHDALPESAFLDRVGSSMGVRILAGVELSTSFEGRDLHLLAYGANLASPALEALCREIQRRRRERLEAILERLDQRAIRLDAQRVAWLRRQSSPGRLHVARELVRASLSTSISAAFRDILERLDDVPPLMTAPAVEVSSIVHAAGGACVLAHPPFGVSADDWKRIIGIGLDGLETRYRNVSNAHRRFLSALAAGHGLIETAGSDFHGDPYSPYLGKHTVNERVVTALWGGGDNRGQ